MSESDRQDGVINVAIVDDDAHVRTGLWWLLNNVVGMRCVGAYSNFSEALAALAERPPDVILMDVSMPGMSGIEAIGPLRAQVPAAKIIMHSNYDDEDKVKRSRQAGAVGYLLKNSSAPTLYDAIVKVHNGGTVWPPDAGAPPTRSTHGPRYLNKLKVLLARIRPAIGELSKR